MTSIPLERLPRPLLARLRSLPGARARVYIVLEEDVYETKFGDGQFFYPRGAFLDEEPAKACMERRMTEHAGGFTYRLKAVEIEREESQNRLVADLQVESCEHCTLEDIVRLPGGDA